MINKIFLYSSQPQKQQNLNKANNPSNLVKSHITFGEDFNFSKLDTFENHVKVGNQNVLKGFNDKLLTMKEEIDKLKGNVPPASPFSVMKEMANAYIAEKAYTDAALIVERMLEMKISEKATANELNELHYQLADIYKQEGNIAKAEEHLNKTI